MAKLQSRPQGKKVISKRNLSIKALQKFKDKDLVHSMTPQEIAEFLESFRNLSFSVNNAKSQLISIKIPQDLLMLFKVKANQEGSKYQTKIKELMRNYVLQK